MSGEHLRKTNGNWRPSEDRPREKLLKYGARHLTDKELLAIFLRVGVAGKGVMVFAEELIEKRGLKWLLESEQAEFCQEKGLGEATYVQFRAVMELSRRYLEEILRRETDPMTSVQRMREYLMHCLGANSNEVFACVFMDNKHRVLEFKEMFYGTVDSARVYPREIVRYALRVNAAALVIAHNHPSGIVEPSDSDKKITRRIREACELVDIRLLDHFIIGGTRTLSFTEEGLL